ncbi:MAG: hypothetical protein LBG44_05775 [Gemmatimonadota bacterium]|nr:hypothetical protein [Gemmatimonadota bacterium]
MSRWLVSLGILAFVAMVIYSTIGGVRSECEVCLEFDGQLVCRGGAGRTEEEARRAAQESVCGGNAVGMSESIACRNATPVNARCSTS